MIKKIFFIGLCFSSLFSQDANQLVDDMARVISSSGNIQAVEQAFASIPEDKKSYVSSRFLLSFSSTSKNLDNIDKLNYFNQLFDFFKRRYNGDVVLVDRSGNTCLLNLLSNLYKIDNHHTVELKLSLITKLLQDHRMVNRVNSHGVSPLMLFAKYIDLDIFTVEVIDNFLDKITNFHSVGPGNNTALHWACGFEGLSKKREKLILYLLEKGLDVNLKNDKGFSPFMYLVSKNADKDVNLRGLILKFIKKGAVISDDQGKKLLEVSSASGAVQATKILLKKVEVLDEESLASVIQSLIGIRTFRYSHLDVLKVLLDYAKKHKLTSVFDYFYKTPEGHRKIIKVVFDLFNQTDINHLSIIQILLENGVSNSLTEKEWEILFDKAFSIKNKIILEHASRNIPFINDLFNSFNSQTFITARRSVSSLECAQLIINLRSIQDCLSAIITSSEGFKSEKEADLKKILESSSLDSYQFSFMLNNILWNLKTIVNQKDKVDKYGIEILKAKYNRAYNILTTLAKKIAKEFVIAMGSKNQASLFKGAGVDISTKILLDANQNLRKFSDVKVCDLDGREIEFRFIVAKKIDDLLNDELEAILTKSEREESASKRRAV